MKVMLGLLVLFLISIPASAEINDTAAEQTILGVLLENGYKDVTAGIGDGGSGGAEKVMVITYSSQASTSNETRSEIGGALGAYIGVVTQGWDCDTLIAVIGDKINSEAIGTWSCEREWKDAFIEGNMTEEELYTRVMGTLQAF